ncbi:MAG: hypothetical protein ACTHLE_04855 [Agriterribacter sp.]
MKKNTQFLPVVIFFAVVSLLFFISGSWLTEQGFNQATLLGGNVFLFVLTAISFLLLRKAIASSSPQIFVRYFYLSFTIKFFLVAIVALIYGRMAAQVSRTSIIVCMVLYIVYTFIEMRILLKAGKK